MHPLLRSHFPLAGILMALVALAGQPSVKADHTPRRAVQIEGSARLTIIELEAKKLKVNAAIFALLGNKYHLRVTGTVPMGARGTVVDAFNERFRNDNDVEFAFEVKEGTPPDPSEDVSIWPLSFTSTPINPLGGGAAPPSSPSIDQLVTLLNSIYGSPDRPVVYRSRSNLVLRGPWKVRRDVKKVLAVVDAPFPQVQLDVWAIQVSGSQKRVSETMAKESKRILEAQDQMRRAKDALFDSLQKEPVSAYKQDLLERLQRLGFCRVNQDPLSLNEAMLMLGCLKEPVELVNRARKAAQKPQGAKMADPFEHLAKALDDTTKHQRIMRAFLCALEKFQDSNAELDTPDEMRLHAQGADRLLQDAVSAYQRGNNEAYLEPVLDDLRKRNGSGGIQFTGRSRIVVTSSLEAGMAATVLSSVEGGLPRPFNVDLFNSAFPATPGQGTGGTETTTVTKPDGTQETTVKEITKDTPLGDPFGALSGLSRLTAGLPPVGALALAGAALNGTQPFFVKVAPGVAINCRPTVLWGGNQARLQIEARFGVTTGSLPGQTTAPADVWPVAPSPTVESHTLRSDLQVSGFELFDLSSFTLASAHPQPPGVIPILGRLPVVGPIFRWPRKDKQVQHECIVLVSSVIVPRALNLAEYYNPKQ